jgi:hypothetical protein
MGCSGRVRTSESKKEQNEMTKDNLRNRVLNGVFHYPNDLDALLDEAAEVTGMNDLSIPEEARKFVRGLAEVQAHRATDCDQWDSQHPMLVAVDNYCDCAAEMTKIINSVRASYDF